jgi:uncharacterized protein
MKRTRPDRPAAGTIPYHLLAKPAGAACNLGCQYCFFLSKENLYHGESHLMSEQMLERYIRQLFESSPDPEVHVAWQGGEPMLRGLAFFRRSVELAEQYRKPHQKPVYTMQTNGTLIDDEWAAFFRKHDYLVGVSFDGPPAPHDTFRVNKKGEGSFADVLRGWNLLRKHGVRSNVLCCISAANAEHPLDVYRFFRDELGAEFIQFIPIVERATPATLEIANEGWGGQRGTDRPLYKQEGSLVTKRSVTAEQFGAFLIGIFDEWARHDIGKVFVTTFDVALGSWLGQHNLCIVAPRCGNALVLEHNGDVYSCDHFVEPGHRLGNIDKGSLRTLVASEKQRRFGDAKFDTLPTYCRECPVLFACYGECPRNRFIRTPDGQPGLNYLCAGYREFFTHIDGPMRAMASLVRQGRFADEYMAVAAPSP